MSTEFHITAEHHLFVGDDRRIVIPVWADHDHTVPYDVSGHDLVWILRHSDQSPTILIEKQTGGSPAGITIEGAFNTDPELNEQVVVIWLGAEDSYGERILQQKNYRYALKRTNTGARSTIQDGNCQFLYRSTAEV